MAAPSYTLCVYTYNYHINIATFLFYFILFYFWLGVHDSPPVGQGLLIHKVSRSHTTHHSQ